MNQPVQKSFWEKAKTFACYAAIGVAAGLAIYAVGKYATSPSPLEIPERPSTFNAQYLTAKPSLPLPVAFDNRSYEELQSISNRTEDLCQDALLDQELCKDNLGIPRILMPQLDQKTLTAFYNKELEKGILVDESLEDPRTLHPVQEEMSAPKVLGIINSSLKGTYKPCDDAILIANDRIIDGHHRFAACHILGSFLHVLRVHDTAQNVLNDLQHFPGIQHFSL